MTVFTIRDQTQECCPRSRAFPSIFPLIFSARNQYVSIRSQPNHPYKSKNTYIPNYEYLANTYLLTSKPVLVNS